MPLLGSRNAIEKMPVDSVPATSGVPLTVHVWPRLLEWKTRADGAPPVVNRRPYCRARDQAGATGGKRPLVWQGRWQILRRHPFPGCSPVVRDDQLKMSLHGVAEGNPVFLVPERDGIEEGFAVEVLELQRPRSAAVRSLVDPSVFAEASMSR